MALTPYTGSLDEVYVAGQEPQKKKKNSISSAVLRGIDLVQANLAGAGAAQADTLNYPKVRNALEGVMQSNLQEAAANPYEGPNAHDAIASFKANGITQGVRDLTEYGVNALSEQAAQAVSSMAAYAIGSKIGGKAGLKNAAGGMIGALANNAAQETGSIYSDILEQTGQREGAKATGYGIASGLVDTAAEVIPLGKVFAGKTGAGNVVADVLKAGVKQMPTGAGTEYVQTGIEQAAVASVDPEKRILTPENEMARREAAAAGAIVGGVTGSAAEAGGRARNAILGYDANGQPITEPAAPEPVTPEPIAPQDPIAQAPATRSVLSGIQDIQDIKTNPIVAHIEQRQAEAESVDPGAGVISRSVSIGAKTGAVAQKAAEEATTAVAEQAAADEKTIQKAVKNEKEQASIQPTETGLPATASQNPVDPVRTEPAQEEIGQHRQSGADSFAAGQPRQIPESMAALGPDAKRAWYHGWDMANSAKPVQKEAPEANGDMQNRDRSRAASVAQMAGIANNPDFDRLSESKTPESGAPMAYMLGDQIDTLPAVGRDDVVVFEDGQKVPVKYAVVEAGTLQASHDASGKANPAYAADLQPGQLRALNNGRTAGLQAAYDNLSADEYRANLTAQADRIGVDPAVIASMDAPVLVRLYSEKDNTPNMGARSNASAGLGLSPSEQANTDASLLGNLDDIRLTEDGEFNPASNMPLIQRFMRQLPATEAGKLTARDGTPTEDLSRRLKNAILSMAYKDPNLVETATESAESRNLMQSLNIAAPRMATLPDDDSIGLRQLVARSAHMLRKAKQAGTTVQQIGAQMDITGGFSPEEEALATFMEENNRTPRKLGEALALLADYAHNAHSSRDDMFGDSLAATKQAAYNFANQKLKQEYGNDAKQIRNEGQQEAGIQRTGESQAQGANEGGAGRADGRSDGEGQEGRPQAELTPADDFALESYTNEEIAAKEAAAQAAADQEAQANKAAENKAKADAELGQFTLTGSDRVSDVAAAAGQNDMFGASSSRPKTNSDEISSSQQANTPAVSKNTVFTEDAAAEALAFLKKALNGSQLNSGIDPQVMMAGITLAGYHIEKGARTFSAYSKAMIEALGENVRPYLKSWYMGVKYDPRAAQFEGMSSAAEIDAASVDEAPNAESDTQPFTHSGLKVYPIRLRGATVTTKWAVQTVENAEREKNGERQIGGDEIVDTREQAIARAEEIVAKHESETKRKAEQSESDRQKEEAQNNAAEAGKIPGVEAYIQFAHADNKMAAGKTRKTLSSQIKASSSGKASSKAEWVDDRLAEGGKLATAEEDKIKPMTRAQINRSDNREQEAHAKRVRDGGKKTVYRIENGDVSWEITKTEYDYAKYTESLKKPPAEPAQATAPKQKPLARTNLGAKTTPQVLSDSQFQSLLGIAADSIEKLRLSDVDRVLSEAPAEYRIAMAERIKDARKDLAQEVDEVLASINGEKGGSSKDSSTSSNSAAAEEPKTSVSKESIIAGLDDRAEKFGREKIREEARNSLAGMILGREFGESIEAYLSRNPALALRREATIEWLAGKSDSNNSESNKPEPKEKDPLGVSEERDLSEYIASDYRNASNSTAIAGTGWVMHDDSINSAGTIQLVSASRNVIRDIKYDSKSGTDHRRAIVKATVWAQENPDKFEAPKGELVSKPVFEKKDEPVTPASKTPTVDQHDAVMASLNEGKLTPEDFKASFNAVTESAEAIKKELATKTKAELLNKGGYRVRMRFSNETKPHIIDAIYRDMISDYAIGGSLTYGMGKGAFEAAVRQQVEATDADKLAKYAEEVAKSKEERKAKVESALAGIENPKTLDDFRNIMRSQIAQGKTYAESRMTMTQEQRAEYDRLEAETTRESRIARKRAAKTSVKAAGQTVGGEIIATKHTKKGHDLYVVQLAERVSKEDYSTLNSSAKRLGGYYSSFRGNGAIPGFQFTDRENADAFLKLAAGDTSAAKDVAEQRRDTFDDDRSQSAAERLTEMADRLDDRADDILSADRKTNTNRRAAMAARAEGAARADKALAETMRNLAKAIESDKAEFLDAVRQKTQVEMLEAIVHRAKDNEIRAKYESYGDQIKHQGEKPTMETADHAEFPAFTAYRSDLASLARKMLEVEGTKNLGKRLMSVADDVSDAYIKFAKENLDRVSQFGRGDKLADFASKDDAEKAIRRSNLVGKAIVLPVKRGQNRIILSPSEAINREIWKGDGDKRIILRKEFGMEMVQAIGRRGNRLNGLTVPWQLETAADRLKALDRIGIETPAEFRSALREFIALREQVAEPDKIKEMERAMIGRRNDGLDFFPTPEATADEMVQAADIQPGMTVLEPSAGMGHIAERIRAAGVEPDVIEMSNDRKELLEAKGFNVIARDFTDLTDRDFTYGDVFMHKDGRKGVMRGSGGMGSNRVGFIPEGKDSRQSEWVDRDDLTGIEKTGYNSGYDRIIMNPPFSDRRDAEHVRHAYSLLRPGGRIVAIMGEGVFYGSDKKAQSFRDWLESVGGTDEKLPEGTFLDPSLPVNTGVNARMVVIDKPESGSATQALDAPVSNTLSTEQITELNEALKNVNDMQGKMARASSSIIGNGEYQHVSRARATTRSARDSQNAEMLDSYKNILRSEVRNLLSRGYDVPEKYIAPIKSKVDYSEDGKYDPINKAPESLDGMQRIDGQTETQAFKRWFGNSVVVERNGDPLVVYHGSPDARFVDEDGIFKGQLERYGMGSSTGGAFWFAASKQTAKSYADDRRAFDYQNAEAGVVPAYIKLENPLVINGLGLHWRQAQKRGKTSDVIEEAQAKGHDGVIIRNVKDDYNSHAGTAATDTYVVFSSTQIKSSEKNNGNFDPENRDIRQRVGSSAGGISRQQAQSVIDKFVEQYKGAQSLGFRIYDTKEEAYGADNLKARNLDNQVLKGGYKDGRVHVILDGHKDAEDLLDTLRHETWTHYGFDLVQPLRKAKILKDLKADIDSDGSLKSIYDQVSRMYRNSKGELPSEKVLIEETVARIAEIYGDQINDKAMESGLKAAVRKILDYVAGVLRSIGLMQKQDGIEMALKFLVQSARTQRSNAYTQFSAATGMQLASQKGDGNWYYSALKEAAADMIQQKGTPEQMTAMLLKQKNVKQAEIEATGLPEFMALQGKSVTKQQIIDYLAGNGVQVQDVMLGETQDASLPEGWKVEEDDGVWTVYDAQGDDVSEGDTRAEAISNAMDEDAISESDAPKFGQYVLPGGKNYRELLLTLPQEGIAIPKNWDEAAVLMRKHGIAGDQAPWETDEQAFERIAKEVAAKENKGSFFSSHYNQPNILAHVRFNERKDAEGRRVLFVEEIQSDWAQKGRKEGFDGGGDKAKVEVIKVENGFVVNVDGLPVWTGIDEARANIVAERKRAEGKITKGIPSAPFVTSTDAWVSLAMKRMIAYAAENGFDRIAWTTGEQQADRYSLSKTVDVINIQRRVDNATDEIDKVVHINVMTGSNISVAIDDNGVITESLKNAGDLVGKNLAEVIGKDITKEIVSSDVSRGEKSISGDGLNIGGEGMKSFYNNIVPKVAKDVLKKVGGGQIDEATFFAPIDRKGEDFEALGFDITPAMRQAVDSGLPLFRRTDATKEAYEKRIDELFFRRTSKDEIINSVKAQLKGRMADAKPSLLGAIPLNYLKDYARNGITAVSDYIDTKRQMDKDRDTLHAQYDKHAQDWFKWHVMHSDESHKLMDLMHASTIAGVDPSKPLTSTMLDMINGIDEKASKRQEYDKLRARYDAMPQKARELYSTIRDDYSEQRQLLDKTIIENISKAAMFAEARAEREYRRAVESIQDDGLTEQEEKESIALAATIRDRKIKAAKAGSFSRVQMLRKVFESNSVESPYFPLFREGDYFAAVYNGKNIREVQHFTKAADQSAFVEEQQAAGYRVKFGRKSNKQDIAGAMDPRFIADIDEVLADLPDADDVRDQIYQRYLESLPDMSVRKSFIHRKKTPGFMRDAMKAYASRMFHGSYQIARMKYTMDLQDSIERAEEQAQHSSDPVNGMALVNELRLRHEWVLNPANSAASQWATTAAFVYYLGASPAQLFLNASQTIMMGIPILGSRYGMAKASTALMGASREFFGSRGKILDALQGNEKRAMQEFYKMGLIDRTQTFDLAGIGENGSGYSAARTIVMGKIGMFFQSAEVFNREVTSLASYRLAVEAGVPHETAVKEAAEKTWQAHFDYTSGNRARYMQNDWARVFLVFRQYSVNMLYRLFRDTRDAFAGETPQIKKEARYQLGGLMGMYGLMAGVTGMPIYGIAMALGKMFDDEDEDFEQEFKIGVMNMLGETAGAVVLNGVPGTATNTDLSSRIGMGNLWFRDLDAQLEGKDAYWAMIEQVLGAVPGIGANVAKGISLALDGNVERGIEAMMPTFVRGAMRGVRYATEGEASTMSGQKMAETTGWDAIAQAMGFTPAHIAERYETNAAIRNAEGRIRERRQKLLNEYVVTLKAGGDKAEPWAAIREFNLKYPALAITPKSIRASIKTRARRDQQTESGLHTERKMMGLRERLELRRAEEQ